MKQKVVWSIVLCICVITSGYAKNKVKGNGTAETRVISVNAYNDLRLGQNIEPNNVSFLGINKKKNFAFNYEQTTGAYTLEITLDENLFPYLEIDQTGQTLFIRGKDDTKINPTIFVVNGQSQELNNVSISGCVDFIAERALTTHNISFHVSGVGDIRIAQLVSENIDCEVSGVGSVYLTGQAANGSFEVSGVGKIYAYDCFVKNLNCEVSGVGSIQANATDKLTAYASGVGNIYYRGNATVDTHTSGIGKIRKNDK
ncbi:head GIN domain-containing protein [Parabacteroides sp. PF5-9]|uniref:head GIN domain-containing protein n=1 Tax=Parabacteroides sp. PF5-9 TaxID=1742404 RepID=UPI002474CDDA|nr:head GIN domain-containing protein [Parabacteroides sp. PF5-9]MDH6357909.1 hypothetical protein [Parabacteroides sp. PF5-9]